MGALPLLTTSVFFQGFLYIAKVVIIHTNVLKKWLPSQGNMLANLAIKIWNTNLQSSFYISSYLLKNNCRNCGDLFFFCEGVIFGDRNLLKYTSFYLFLFFHFLRYFANLKIRLLIIVTMGYYLPHFIVLKEKFHLFDDKLFFGKFWMNVIFSVILTNFAIQGENFTKNFGITNMKIITLWITNLFFFSPVPKAKITHQQNWMQTSEVIWFLVNIWYCGWTKRKLENLLKCNLEKKAQSNGKNRQSFKTAKLKKINNTLANTSTTKSICGEFSHCAYKKIGNLEILIFLGENSRKKPPNWRKNHQK